MSDVYPYPGDDPSALSTFSFSIEAANGFVTQLSKGLRETRSELQSAWTGAAAKLAQADMATLTAAFPPMGTKLEAAQTAVDSYRTTVGTIRGRVDELRTQHAKLAAALQSEQESYARAGRLMQANADPGTSSAEIDEQTASLRASIHGQEVKTQNQLNGLDEQYRALVARSNAAAATCKLALQSASTQYEYQGSTPTTQGVAEAFGLSGLQVAHYQAAVTAGKQAATLATQINGMNAIDPDIAKKIAALDALMSQYYGDPAFSTPFYQQLGQEGALKLPLQIGLAKGEVTGQELGQLQRTLGADLAAATQYYGNGAGNADGIPQLSDAWVKTLMDDGSKRFQINSSYAPTIYGYQGLGLLLHTGQYDAKFLDDSGNAIKDFESGDEKKSDGVPPWIDWGGPGPDTPGLNRLWWGGDGGATDDNGVDPMVGWSKAGDHNQPAFEHALAHDNGLLDYLVNDRDWSTNSDIPPQGRLHHALYDQGQVNHGLITFGNALGHSAGIGAQDPDSRMLMKNLVDDLGDPSKNHRIGDAGGFQSATWIPNELRPGLALVTAANIDEVHNSLSGRTGPDSPFVSTGGGKESEYLVRFLGDVGKDPWARARLGAAENGYVQGILQAGFHDGATNAQLQPDIDAAAALHGVLDFGFNQGNSAASAAADQAANDTVDMWSGLIQIGADKAAGSIPVVGDLATSATDALIGSITDSFHVDHSGQVAIDNANANVDAQAGLQDVVRQSYIDAIPHDQQVAYHLVDADGHTLPVAQIDSRAVEAYYASIGRDDPTGLPDVVATKWGSAFGSQGNGVLNSEQKPG